MFSQCKPYCDNYSVQFSWQVVQESDINVLHQKFLWPSDVNFPVSAYRFLQLNIKFSSKLLPIGCLVSSIPSVPKFQFNLELSVSSSTWEHLTSSLHNRCFMSQTRWTRHFARSERRARIEEDEKKESFLFLFPSFFFWLVKSVRGHYVL